MSELVSIIIPAYNAEKYIENCLKSCIAQTYKDIEIIVVNDGSTDNTAKIAESISLQDSRIKIISTENGGVSKARNIGMQNINGKYFAFLDVDDSLLKNSIEILFSTINITEADIVSGKHIVAEIGSNIKIPKNERGNNVSRVLKGTQPIECSLNDDSISYSVWGKLYRRHAFEEVRFIEGRKVHEDSFFLFECFMKQPKLVDINEYVYVYAITPSSASRSDWSEKFFDIIYFAERKTQLIEEKLPDLLEMTYNLNIKANMAMLYNLCKTYDKKYRIAEKKCIKYIIEHKNKFLPVSKENRRWFSIIKYHLYFIYKAYYWIKNHRRHL